VNFQNFFFFWNLISIKITIFETATITQQTEIPMGQGYPKIFLAYCAVEVPQATPSTSSAATTMVPTSSPMAPTAPNTNTPNTNITPKVSNALQLVVSSIGILSGLLLL
jgi:hypothetical protein